MLFQTGFQSVSLYQKKRANSLLPAIRMFLRAARRLALGHFILLCMALAFLSGCHSTSDEITTLEQLEKGMTFAVPTGTVADQSVLKRFPNANLTYYNSIYDCALAVQHGKADATVYDKPVLKNLAAKNEGLKVLDELVAPDRYGFAVALGNQFLKGAMDSTLAEIRKSGAYDEMVKRWLPDRGKPGEMPELEGENTEGVLIFGTAAVTEPMSFMNERQEIVGFDIEFASRIAKRLHKKLEIVNLEFGAMLPALIAGKVDMIGAGLSITEERAKSVLFSESYYEGGLVALVRTLEKTPPPAADKQKIKGEEKKKKEYKEIGVLMGSIHEGFATKTYPKSHIQSFNTVSDMLLALDAGKVEAAFMDHVAIREILAKNPSFRILEENLFTVDIAAGFHQQADELREQFNTFLKEIRDNGIWKEMEQRWMEDTASEMPVITVSNPSGVLKAGIVSDLGIPFTTRKEGAYIGFDIELNHRFAAFLGKEIEWVDMPFGSLLPSLVSGKIDVITASMMITEERSKQIDFSDPYYASGVSILGRKGTAAELPGKMSELKDIADKRIGIFTGTIHDAYLQSHYPKARIHRFETTADMILALNSGKIDAAMLGNITASVLMKSNPHLGVLSEDVLDMPLGVGFQKKNKALLKEFNAYLTEIRQDGTYDEMMERWFVNDPEKAKMPRFKPPASGKKLTVGVAIDDLPYSAMINGKLAGLDIEMIQTFAHRNNYKLKFSTMEFSALIAALAAGKVDMVTDGIAITKERSRQISFSDPYATFRTAVIAPRKNLAGYDDEDEEEVSLSFWQKLSQSFYNNIILEKRYLMILRGLLVTLLISIFSAVAGTLLGGLVCFMRMSKKRLLRSLAIGYISLVRGTPVLVLLMIIYYVVFASVNISPVLVAVLAFGFNFAAYVSEMFRSSIDSIDRGQQEAGIATGFTRVQTFIFIIMPQAVRRVLPVYKGEFISLVKMTSVVGYIAVEDLTKASDIIRSRTFDAFFPLLMAAVIYILLSWLLTAALNRIEISITPRKQPNPTHKTRKEITL